MRTWRVFLLGGCCAAAALAGCATPSAGPREYLDETTAATITAVAEPWVLVSARSQAAARNRDFLSVYAIDVNRMGDHRQYLAVLQWWPAAAATAAATRLELATGQQTFSLRAAAEEARQLGIVQPPGQAYTEAARWWYFPVDRNVLSSVAAARDLSAVLLVDTERSEYTVWRDGSAELAEWAAALP